MSSGPPILEWFELHEVANNKDEIASFEPYVPSINDHGVVAFQATMRSGRSAVFTRERDETAKLRFEEGVTSHPDINNDNAVCAYVKSTGLEGIATVDYADRFLYHPVEGIGPLGPTVNELGDIAYRALRNGVSEVSIMKAGSNPGPSCSAHSGADYDEFFGLPLALQQHGIAYRSRLQSGVEVIDLCDAKGLKRLASCSDATERMSNFIDANSAGDVAFCVSGTSGSHEVRIACSGTEGILVAYRCDFDFECLRAAWIDDERQVTFAATPAGGTLGIYHATQRGAQRLIGIGDELFGRAIEEFALNSVSFNRAGEFALRMKHSNGYQSIVLATRVLSR